MSPAVENGLFEEEKSGIGGKTGAPEEAMALRASESPPTVLEKEAKEGNDLTSFVASYKPNRAQTSHGHASTSPSPLSKPFCASHRLRNLRVSALYMNTRNRIFHSQVSTRESSPSTLNLILIPQ